jgi:hypothetical protein
MDHRDSWINAITETLGEVPYGESTAEEDHTAAVALLKWLEPKIRADERARIVAWLREQADDEAQRPTRDNVSAALETHFRNLAYEIEEIK